MRAHPNPFNPSTTITYTVPEASAVTVALFDVGGQRVETLVDNEHRERGEYRIDYSATGATGIYFVRLEAGEKTSTLKLVVLK